MPFFDQATYDKLTKHQHYAWASKCFDSDIGKLEEGDVSGWKWFSDNTNANIGEMYGGSGNIKCSNTQVLQRAISYTVGDNVDPFEFFCSMTNAKYKYDGSWKDVDDATTKERCINKNGSTPQWDNNPDVTSQSMEDYQKRAKDPSIGDKEKYMRAYATLLAGDSCQARRSDTTEYATEAEARAHAGGGTKLAIGDLKKQPDGSITVVYKVLSIDNQDKYAKTGEIGENVGSKCSSLAADTIKYVSAYRDAVNDGQHTENTNLSANGTSSDGTPQKDTTTCAIDGVGWIVCPILNFMGDLNDQAFSAISGFLTVDPSLLGDNTKTAWSQFRDIANVAFVIAFLIIIYSQVSGAGVSNYGIKKLLPKIIIAAILVNASFLICQIAVDLSNILGSSIYGFMKGIPTTAGDAATGLPAWKEVSGKVLALGAAALLAVLLLTVFSTAALLAVAMTVLILIARKSLLILLIVISPIAFVAYLLPNTEDLFKKWMKIFRDLLMVFPVVGLIFGASTLAARIINGSSTDILIQLTALGVMAVPLFAVPVVLKGALAATGTLGAKLSGWQDKANAGALNAAKNGRLGEAWSAHQARRQENKVNRRMGNGRIARLGKSKYLEGTRAGKALVWTGSRGAAFDRTRPGKILGGDRGAAAAVASYHKAVGEEVDRRQTLLSDKSGDELVGMLEKGGMSAEEEAAVHRQIAKVGGDKHVQKSIDHIMRSRDSGGDHARDVQQLSAEALLKRKPSGLGSEDANKLINGSLGENTGGTTGYKDLLQDRVQKGKLGAKDYAAMSKDDLIRLGELSRASKLSDDDILKMNAEFTAIEKDETLKGTLTDERRALYKSILDGGGPKGADGSDYSIRGPTAL